MKESDKLQIGTVLRAFVKNFDNITIEDADFGKGYFVYQNGDSTNTNAIQYCPTIDFLEGWMWGCIQAKNGIVKGVE